MRADHVACRFERSVPPASLGLSVMHVQRHKRFGIGIGFCLLVTGLAAGLYLPSKQPTYRGQPISYWFSELPLTLVRGQVVMSAERIETGDRKYGAQREKPEIAVAAIQEIGVKGLPFIMRKFSRRQTPIREWLQARASWCGVKRSLFPNPELERAQAVTALVALKSLPPQVMSQLHDLSGNGTNSIALSAAHVLTARRGFGSITDYR